MTQTLILLSGSRCSDCGTETYTLLREGQSYEPEEYAGRFGGDTVEITVGPFDVLVGLS